MDDLIELRKEIENIISLKLGTFLVGIADVRDLHSTYIDMPEEAFKLERAISIALPLNPLVLATISNQPTMIYKHHYRSANFLLDDTAFVLSNFLNEKGYKSIPIPASVYTDHKSERAHLSHRDVAVRAYLGWYGKNNLLVTKEYGSQIRLVTVLTNVPLPVKQRVLPGCGSCKACIKVCPVNAIKIDGSLFDKEACFSKVTEFSKHIIGLKICGICLRACGGERQKTLNF